MRLALIDCDDSFTLNIYDYLCQCHFRVDIVHHNNVEINALSSFHAIVLSPGPNSPLDLPILFDILNRYASIIPILGICLGHQAIGMYYGHELIASPNPMHGIPVKLYLEEDEIYHEIDKQSFLAMRYNSLAVNDSSDSELQVIARDDKGEIMAYRHKKHLIYSFQFHPESVGTVEGIKLFSNWKRIIENT